MQRRPARRSFSGGGRAPFAHGHWIQLPLDRRRVIDNLQMRSAGELPKVAWMLWRWRMMQEFSRIAFHDSINIVNAQLALVNKEPVRWRFAFEERDCPFDSPNPPDERADQQRDDAEMRDEECKMMFTPGPARERGTGKIRSQQNQPEIEPRRAINIGARNFRVETRFVNRAGDRCHDQYREQNDSEF